MSRTPTLPSAAYRWHRASLAGKNPPITHDAQCGWFQRRAYKGGPFVPARIFYEQPINPETGELDGDEVMRCEVGGKRRPPDEEWTWLAGNPITQERFLEMSAPSFCTDEPAKPHNLPF